MYEQSTPDQTLEVDNTRKGYESFFDKIDFSKEFPKQEYRGTLESAIDALSEELKADQPDVASLILYPPRLMRAIIDTRVEFPEDEGLIDLYYKTLLIITSVYSSDAKSLKLLGDFRRQLQEQPSLLKREIQQKKDAASWYAGEPENAERAVGQLETLTGGTDIVFLPLAHGGVATGYDIFLRYIQNTSSINSVAFPIRFSRNKMKDEEPQVDEELKDMIGKFCDGRTVVIYEEDTVTEKTILSAEAFFKKNFPDAKIVKLSSSDSINWSW